MKSADEICDASRALAQTTMAKAIRASETIVSDHEALKKVWDEAETTFFDFSDIARGIIRKEKESEQKEAAEARDADFTKDEEYFRLMERRIRKRIRYMRRRDDLETAEAAVLCQGGRMVASESCLQASERLCLPPPGYAGGGQPEAAVQGQAERRMASEKLCMRPPGHTMMQRSEPSAGTVKDLKNQVLLHQSQNLVYNHKAKPSKAKEEDMDNNGNEEAHAIKAYDRSKTFIRSNAAHNQQPERLCMPPQDMLEEANQRLQFKARPGCACPQEVMRAKIVAHGCQRPPFNARGSNGAGRRPQRPFYARASYCARRRPQRPRFHARAGCCARRRPQRPRFYARAGCCARRRPQRPRFYARAGCCACRRPQRPRYYAVVTTSSKARPGCACTQEVMQAKKVAHGCQTKPSNAKDENMLEEANHRLQFKARPGCACPQEVMRAKIVAHGCQRPLFNAGASNGACRRPQRPFYARASYCARRRPQRPFYARASYCARRRPQRPRFYARAGCCACRRPQDLAYVTHTCVTRRNEVMGVLGVVEVAARFPLPLPTDELM
jgi:hypothetical protein